MSRDDYIEVSERIQAFYTQYPEGSLQSEWSYVDRAGDTWILFKAYAYRNPTDPRPGVGHAIEQVPGATPYTRGSEWMVGETSAWGRALAALGIAVHRGIASANEVRAAQARSTTRTKPTEPLADEWSTQPGQGDAHTDLRVNAKQLAFIKVLCDKAGMANRDDAAKLVNATLIAAGLPTVAALSLMPKAHASTVIDLLQKSEPIEQVLASIEPLEP